MTLSPDFKAQILAILPPDEAESLFHTIETTEPSVSVRLNTAKVPLPGTTSGNSPKAIMEPVPWCSRGFYLDGRQPFTFDPLLHAGAYYVQDASSMIVQHIVAQLVDSPVRYLDLCAAPGGKTTAALDALPEGSLMVTNEIMPDRARILLENVVKWGNAACVVTSDSSDRFATLSGFFDVVAADVPCSGEGMFRKDAEAVAQWTPRLVAQCAERQREIVGNAWQALRPGGIFIYSTCTYNRSENEAMVEHLISEYDAESIDLCFPDEWLVRNRIGTDAHCYRFMPHRTRGEGLFVAVLRKPGNAPHAAIQPSKPGKKGKSACKEPQLPKAVGTWVNGDYAVSTAESGSVIALPASHSSEIAMLRSKVRVLHAGVEIATIKGHDAVPAQSLALSTALNADAFPVAELDYATAIAYLRGESITLTDSSVPRGFAIVAYRGLPLGFVKNLGNRANNLYPKEWRIKSTHIPDTPPQIIQ